MNAWAADLLSNSLAQRIAWALIHFLWQGAAVALLLGAILQLVRGRSAQIRWVLCCGALGLMAALPAVTACVVSVDAPVPVVAGPVARAMPTPEAFTLPPAEEAPGPAPAPARVPDGAAEVDSAAPWGVQLEQFLRPALPWSFAAWLVGLVVISVWHLGGWLLLERTKRHGVRFADGASRDVFDRLLRRLRVSRPVRLLQSTRVAVPTVAGWLRPVVLLPVSALSGLSIEQTEAILAHELAHVRRYDCLVRLIQAVVETLLFYHPAVWWVSRGIRQESEHCCDDAGVAVCGSRVTYARALATMEDFRAAPAAAAAASGGRLLDRIRRIVGLPDRDSLGAARWLARLLVMTCLAAAALISCGHAALTQPVATSAKEPATQPAAADSVVREDIAWGKAGGGIRVGLSPARITLAKVNKKFELVFHQQNVSGGELEMPALYKNTHYLLIAIETDGKLTFLPPSPRQKPTTPPRRIRFPAGQRMCKGVDFAFPTARPDYQPFGVLPELKIGKSMSIRAGWNERRMADTAASWKAPGTRKSGPIVIERVPPPPPPPLAKMARGADRIVVVRAGGDELRPSNVLEVLKGDSSSASDQQPRLPGGAKKLPGDFDKMILFLRVEGDGRQVPELHPVNPAHWFVPYRKDVAEKVRKLIPLPDKWGRPSGDLQMGLRVREPKFAAGENVPVEICIRNVGKKRLSLAQHRYNIYDYYQLTRLTVVGAGGTRWELAKPAGVIHGLDDPAARTLEPGGVYIHTIRLNRWPLKGESFEPAARRRPNPLTQPGRYTVRCTYAVPKEIAAHRAKFERKGVFWHGTLISNDLTVNVVPREAATRPATQPAAE